MEAVGTLVGRALPDGRLRSVVRDGYNEVLFALTARRGLKCTLPAGEVVRLLPRFRHATWNPVEYASFRQNLKPGDVAIDVGANVGAYTLLFGAWVGATGRVYAFEPSVDANAGLARHVALNALVDVVEVRPEAITAQVGEAAFSGTDINGANHVLAGVIPSNAVRVSTTTLDAFCSARDIRPALIKVDAEGAELDVLRGARNVIAANRGRIALFVELHPDAWASAGISRDDVEAELRHQGLTAVPLREDRDPWTTNGECVRLVHSD